jgi:CubicO group peptidase (beta-lactamase class C family)
MIETATQPRTAAAESGRTAIEASARTPARIDDGELRQRVQQILNRHPVVGMAIGVVRNGRLDFFHAHGFADIASATPIDQDTVFRVASITKTFTAIAVLQLVERGLLDLDLPAARYLRVYTLVPAKPSFRAATIRHLLTHTAGVPEVRRPSDVVARLFGELVRFGEPLPPLADYYGGGLRIDAEPGSRYIYTDHDFATLGQIVQDVSGQPVADYMRENIFRPLGMADTDLVRTKPIAARLATGYDIGRRGPKRIPDYDVISVGGGAAYSTPRDMARYLAALLGGGANEHGSVLKPDTLALMFAAQYQPDHRLPGVGLAFTRFDLDGHPAVEHGGILPGFISQVCVAPQDGVAVMGFTNGSRLGMVWLPSEMARLLRQVIGIADDGIRKDIPQHPEVWKDLCGWYRVSAKLTDVRTRAMTFAGVEVFVRRGVLMLRFLSPIPPLYRGFALHPDDETDPYVFRVDLSPFGVGTARVVFSQEEGLGTTRVHCELMPLTLEKQPALTNPRLWVGGAFCAFALGGLVTGVRRLATR